MSGTQQPASEPTWFAPRIGFAVGSDWDTVGLGLGSLVKLSGELTLTGEAPFPARIVSVRHIDEDSTVVERCGFLYQRLDTTEYEPIDPLASPELAPYETIVGFTVY